MATILILFGIGYTIDYNSMSFLFSHDMRLPSSPSLVALSPIQPLRLSNLHAYSAPQTPQERSSLECGVECITINSRLFRRYMSKMTWLKKQGATSTGFEQIER